MSDETKTTPEPSDAAPEATAEATPATEPAPSAPEEEVASSTDSGPVASNPSATTDEPETPDVAPAKVITRDGLEVKPERMKKDQLVQLIRDLDLAAEIDLRAAVTTLREQLFARRPDLAPPTTPTPQEALAQQLSELQARAAAGDANAADEARDVSERLEREQAELAAFDLLIEEARPARAWLREHGFESDPRHMSTGLLLEKLLGVASLRQEDVPSDLLEPVSAWLGAAMLRLTPEERAIVNTAREAAARAHDAAAIARAEEPPKVRFVLVERASRFVREGFVYDLAPGSVLASTEYDLDELLKQGVAMRAITSAEATRLRALSTHGDGF